jgi:prophage regulatory protein
MRSRNERASNKRSERPEKRVTANAAQSASERANDSGRLVHRVDKLALLPLKLLRFTAVRERTGLSRSTVWRLERVGAFPKHIKVSANIVAWLEEDIIEWIRSRANGLVA